MEQHLRTGVTWGQVPGGQRAQSIPWSAPAAQNVSAALPSKPITHSSATTCDREARHTHTVGTHIAQHGLSNQQRAVWAWLTPMFIYPLAAHSTLTSKN